MSRFRAYVLVGLLLAGSLRAALTEAERAWMQDSLDNWERICRHYLGITAEPLPWIIYFDVQHAWHVNPERGRLPVGAVRDESVQLRFAGRRLDVYRLPHEGKLWVPAASGPLPLEPRAAAFLYDGDTKPYFILALASFWRTLPGAAKFPGLEEFFLGVASHEICHTRQLADVARRVTQLRAKGSLPKSLDDDIVQLTFKDDAGYRAHFDREREILTRAVMENDPARSRALTREALAAARERRTKFFAADKAILAEMEDMFVVMEGVAEWCQYRLAREKAPGKSPGEVYRDILGRNSPWVQEHGLLVFLLIDRFAPGWQKQFLSADFPSPFSVLEQATAN